MIIQKLIKPTKLQHHTKKLIELRKGVVKR